MYLGSHVSIYGLEMLVGSVKEAKSYGANVFMIYTGAPQNTKRRPIEEFRIDDARQLMTDNGIAYFTVHAPYILNLANAIKKDHHYFAIDFLRKEIERTQAIGAEQITLHPGSHVGIGVEKGIKQVCKGLNQVIDPKQTVQISLETMAGKGTELASTFEEIAEIIAGVTHNDKLSVTFDTCHVHDAGYDVVNRFDDVLDTFDKIIGLERLKVVHINDSKNPCGSRKDRHANIGYGRIGFNSLKSIVHHPQLKYVPKLLETPWIQAEDDNTRVYPPYKFEIEMLKSEVFNEHLMGDVVNYYKVSKT